MKVAHLISNYFPKMGGAQTCIHNLARKLVQHGHQVSVITVLDRSKISKETLEWGYQLLTLNPLILKILYKNAFIGKFLLRVAIRNLQEKYKFDIWQVTIGYPLGVFIVDYLRKNNIVSVLRCSGEDIQVVPEVNYGYRLNKKVRHLIKENYNKFDALIALSDSVRKEYMAIKIPKEKIHIIPNGVDCNAFSIAFDRKAGKSEFGLYDNEKLIITVGRNHPKKGYCYIPEIIEILLKKRNDFRWLIVGKGSEQVKLVAKKKGVDKYLITTEVGIDKSPVGDIEVPARKLIEYYKLSDIFVLPTIVEGFPNVLIEAMAAGLPIVTTDAPGVREIIDHNKNGLKHKVGDVNSMAKSILNLLENETLANTLKDNALRDVRKYDWEVVVSSYQKLYLDLFHARRNGYKLQ